MTLDVILFEMARLSLWPVSLDAAMRQLAVLPAHDNFVARNT
jgi:hypothetical protein